MRKVLWSSFFAQSTRQDRPSERCPLLILYQKVWSLVTFIITSRCPCTVLPPSMLSPYPSTPSPLPRPSPSSCAALSPLVVSGIICCPLSRPFLFVCPPHPLLLCPCVWPNYLAWQECVALSAGTFTYIRVRVYVCLSLLTCYLHYCTRHPTRTRLPPQQVWLLRA